MMLAQRDLVLMVLMLMWCHAAPAVMSGSDAPPPRPSDSDYSAGVAAFEGANWQGVVDSMSKAVAKQPWNDNAYNLMGFAYRKLGNYPRALAAYQKALDLNPHHRGALEYLGETYLAMGCIARANEVLEQLQTACKRMAADGGTKQGTVTCEEWVELKAAIDAVSPTAEQTCALVP